MSDYLTDGTPVLISGITGAGQGYGGKSATANWWSTYLVQESDASYDVGVFYNPKHNANVSVSGNKVVTAGDLAKQYAQGRRMFDFHPRSLDGVEEHKQLLGLLRQFDGSAVVVHDEAPDYAEAESLEWAVRRGGNEAQIKNLVIAQRPWDLPSSLLTNLPLVAYVGPAGAEAERYFKSMGISGAMDTIRERHDPYCWSIIDKGPGEVIETYDPVPEKFA